MKETEKYKLRMPEAKDPFDIRDFNQNTETIDSVMRKFQSEVDEMSQQMEIVIDQNSDVGEQIETLGALLDEAKELAENGVQSVNGKSGKEIALDYRDIGAVPLERKVNGHALSGDITLTQEDIGMEIDMSSIEAAVANLQKQVANHEFHLAVQGITGNPNRDDVVIDTIDGPEAVIIHAGAYGSGAVYI